MPSTAEQLMKLAEMKEKGLLDADEFKEQKAKVLADGRANDGVVTTGIPVAEEHQDQNQNQQQQQVAPSLPPPLPSLPRLPRFPRRIWRCLPNEHHAPTHAPAHTPGHTVATLPRP